MPSAALVYRKRLAQIRHTNASAQLQPLSTAPWRDLLRCSLLTYLLDLPETWSGPGMGKFRMS